MKYKSNIKSIAAMIAIGTFSSILTFYVHKKLIEAEALENMSMGSILAITAKNINKQTPVILDKFTRLDSATTIVSYVFVYNYTLLGESSLEDKKETVKMMRPVLKQKVLTSEDMKVFRDNKIGITYVYNDEGGQEIGRVNISKGEYK